MCFPSVELTVHSMMILVLLCLPAVLLDCCSISHHPGSGKGWFLITYRAPDLPNSELRVAPVDNPTQQTVSLLHTAVEGEGA